jgi:ATP-dependent DNA helicase PIF1
MLNEMRFGKLSAASIAAFKALSRPIHYTDNIEPTALFPRREDVDRANKTRLEALNTEGWSYTSTDGGTLTDPAQRDKVLSNMMASQLIELKIDAQVMLIKNVDETLVNGSMGRVIGFCHKALYVIETNGRWKGEDGAFEGLDEEEREKREKIAEMLRSKTVSGGSKPLPVVRFKVPGGGQRDMLVEQDSFKNELPNGEVQVSRNQVSSQVEKVCMS